jgi:hypothetical protein
MSKLLRIVGAALLAACFSEVAPAHANSAVPANATMAYFVRAVLPHATRDFSSLRGAKIESDLPNTAYGGYKLRLKGGLCSGCRIYDWYGRGARAESWSVANIYTQGPSGTDDLIEPFSVSAAQPNASPIGSASPAPEVPPFMRTSAQPEWPIEKTEAYVKSQLAPLLTGFSLRRTSSSGLTGENVPTLLWRGPHNVWVEAQMYPHMAAGIVKVRLRVRHDLTKSTHMLSNPTRAQLTQMQGAIRRIILAAVPAASGDFSRLRGAVKKDDTEGHDYRATASFGSTFRPCEVLDIAARMGQSWDRNSEPAWAMLCSTFPMLGARPSLGEIARSTISAALPRGFTSAADAKLHGYDYLWKNDKGVSVAIDWGDPHEDVVGLTVRIMHSLPKQ